LTKKKGEFGALWDTFFGWSCAPGGKEEIKVLPPLCLNIRFIVVVQLV